MTIYKLRDKATGLYSTGTGSPRWNKTGKSWSQRGHLTNHLHCAITVHYNPYAGKDLEVEVHELVRKETIQLDDYWKK